MVIIINETESVIIKWLIMMTKSSKSAFRKESNQN